MMNHTYYVHIDDSTQNATVYERHATGTERPVGTMQRRRWNAPGAQWRLYNTQGREIARIGVLMNVSNEVASFKAARIMARYIRERLA